MNTNGTLFQIFRTGAVLLMLPMAVQAQFTWIRNGDAITITAYTNFSGGAVTVPDTITGFPVTSIGSGAFYGANVTSVTTGTNLTSIGDEAFMFCGGLTNMTIGPNVTSLGLETFFGCSSLDSVTLPAKIASIGQNSFTGCSSLEAILVASSNSNFSSLGGVLFNQNQTTLITCPEGLAGNYTISGTVTSIGLGAFDGCTSLTGIIISSNVTSIGESAFEDCTQLTDLSISNKVTSIGEQAFSNCSSLPTVTIPASVTSIGEYAFSACVKLTNIEVNVSNPAFTSVAGVLFNKNQNALVEFPGGFTGVYTVSNGVTTISAGAFVGCTNVTTVIMPGSIASIEDFAFEDCSSLTAVDFQGNAPTPGQDVFLDDFRAKVYYYAGTSGWISTYGGLTTVKLNPPPELMLAQRARTMNLVSQSPAPTLRSSW